MTIERDYSFAQQAALRAAEDAQQSLIGTQRPVLGAQVEQMLERVSMTSQTLYGLRNRVIGSHPDLATANSTSKAEREPTFADRIQALSSAIGRLEGLANELNLAF